jgi:hypothetical protein
MVGSQSPEVVYGLAGGQPTRTGGLGAREPAQGRKTPMDIESNGYDIHETPINISSNEPENNLKYFQKTY